MAYNPFRELDIELTGDGSPPLMPPADFPNNLTEPFHVDIKQYGFSRYQLEAFIGKSPIREACKFDYSAQRPAEELFADFIKHFRNMEVVNMLHLSDYYVAVFILYATVRNSKIYFNTSLWVEVGNLLQDLPMDCVTAMAPKIFDGLTNVDSPGKYTKIAIMMGIMENKDFFIITSLTGRRIVIRLLGHMLAVCVRKPFQAEQFDKLPVIFEHAKTINWLSLMNFYHFDELLLKLRIFSYLMMLLRSTEGFEVFDGRDRFRVATFFKSMHDRIWRGCQLREIMTFIRVFLCPLDEFMVGSNDLFSPSPSP